MLAPLNAHQNRLWNWFSPWLGLLLHLHHHHDNHYSPGRWWPPHTGIVLTRSSGILPVHGQKSKRSGLRECSKVRHDEDIMVNVSFIHANLRKNEEMEFGSYLANPLLLICSNHVIRTQKWFTIRPRKSTNFKNPLKGTQP